MWEDSSWGLSCHRSKCATEPQRPRYPLDGGPPQLAECRLPSLKLGAPHEEHIARTEQVSYRINTGCYAVGAHRPLPFTLRAGGHTWAWQSGSSSRKHIHLTTGWRFSGRKSLDEYERNILTMTGDLKASSEGEDSPDGKTPKRPHAVCVWGGWLSWHTEPNDLTVHPAVTFIRVVKYVNTNMASVCMWIRVNVGMNMCCYR